MKNENISPNMANSSFVRMNNIYMAMRNENISPNMANYSFVSIKNIYCDEKCKYFAKFGEFSHRRIVFKKTSPPPRKKKKEKKGAGSNGDERRDVMNGKQSRGVCGSTCGLSFAKYALWMGCVLLNAISHTTPPSLSLSLSPRAHKTRQAPLTSPQIRFLSFYPVLAPAKNRGSAGEMKRRQF
jgi:hypothetical protein